MSGICQTCGTPYSSKNRFFCSNACSLPASKNRRHGMNGTSENNIWKAMRKRCFRLKDPAYPHYGGRGITCCERWNYFENFYADMGPRPAGLSLERRDNNKGYSPDNCYWATPLEQSRNRNNVWTSEQIRLLREGTAAGCYLPELVTKTGRSAAAVSGYAYKHGISIPRRPYNYHNRV